MRLKNNFFSFNHRLVLGLLLVGLCLFLVAIGLPLHLSSVRQEQPVPPSGQTTTDSLFASFASFNGSIPQCITPDGTLIWTASYTTFGRDYAACRSQLLSDYDFLGKNNVKTLRIWPVLSTFAYNQSTNSWGNLNNYISNLDEVLAEFHKNGMKAYVTLLSTPDCSVQSEYSSYLGYFFNPDLVQNPKIQDEFIRSFAQFITRYKDDPAIGAYDFINEINKPIEAAPAAGSKGGLCNLYYDDNRSLKIEALLKRMYTVAKSIDKMHPMTFSSGGAAPPGSPVMNVIHDVVDFYDVHLYSNDPVSSYKDFPVYDKPVIQGEVGISTEGNCEPSSWDLAPEMSMSCQQKWLANTEAFVQQARLHNVQNVFFHFWPASKRFGIRVDDGTHTFLGHKMTLAGQYILNLDSNKGIYNLKDYTSGKTGVVSSVVIAPFLIGDVVKRTFRCE